jgi:hypothetical protein
MAGETAGAIITEDDHPVLYPALLVNILICTSLAPLLGRNLHASLHPLNPLCASREQDHLDRDLFFQVTFGFPFIQTRARIHQCPLGAEFTVGALHVH